MRGAGATRMSVCVQFFAALKYIHACRWHYVLASSPEFFLVPRLPVSYLRATGAAAVALTAYDVVEIVGSAAHSWASGVERCTRALPTGRHSALDESVGLWAPVLTFLGVWVAAVRLM